MKYRIDYSNKFKKQYKKIKKQGKDLNKLFNIVELLANGINLDTKYKDHALKDDKFYKNCRECHIEPDWLLVYQIIDDNLILLLFATGSHSDLFN